MFAHAGCMRLHGCMADFVSCAVAQTPAFKSAFMEKLILVVLHDQMSCAPHRALLGRMQVKIRCRSVAMQRLH